MKSKAVLLAALNLLVLLAPAQASELDDARALFNEREFVKASELFEKVAATAPSAGVFFELGRAYDGLGNNARAALSFQRALVLDPRFAPARNALREANTRLGLASPPATWQTKLAETIPLDPLAIGATVLLWLGAFLFVLGTFSEQKKFRVLLGILAVLLALTLLTSTWLSDPRVANRDTAMVLTAGGANALASPAEQSEKVASLPEGALITVLSQRGRWFFAKLPSGATGWIPTDGIVPVIPIS